MELIAKLRAAENGDDTVHRMNLMHWCGEAANEIERLRKAAETAIKIIDVNLHHQREKVTDAVLILREALNQ
jgi:molybdopterin synthase catalytic subunit